MLRRAVVIGLVGVLGCGPLVGSDEGEGSGSASNTQSATGSGTMTSTSTSAGGTISVSGGTADGTAEGMDTFDSAGFIDCGAAPPGSSLHCISVPVECDLLHQEECGAGNKCSPWLDGGNGWSSTQCVPVAPRPQGADEPCTIVANPWSGFDDCDQGLVCVPQDGNSLVGVCWPLCWAGLDGALECDEGTCVVQPGELAIPICERACDPVAGDCEHGDCDAGGEIFGCTPALGPAAGLGETCTGLGQCGPGATCYDGAAVPDCAGSMCCAAFCDRLDPDPDAACDGLTCVGFFGEMSPAGYEHVGVCAAG